ncbi:MAG: signal peptidase II [Planctomycetes bacterium]|nr:signal peptidase II [Planctomycetota bacterium]
MSDRATGVVEPRENVREPLVWFVGKWWFWVPILPLVALDLWSKASVFAHLESTQGHAPEGARFVEVWTGVVKFELVQYRNTGTIWGLAKDFTSGLVVLRFVAMGVLVYIAARTPSLQRFKQLVLGLIMAGAIGNLYDNLTQPYSAVRDFLEFSWVRDGVEVWSFPAFNVADSCICVGAITLAILLWREDAQRARAS